MVEKKTTKPDYVETKPSAALMAALTATGLPIAEGERNQIAKEGADLDKRYRVVP